MSLLSKGANRLSQLEIDVSKDWAGRLIKNLGDAVDSNDAVKKAQAILQPVMTGRGDILYRGDSEAVRLAPSYGVGYNFLHMKNSGQFEPEWLDIQSLIIYLTGAVNRVIVLPSLIILAPALSMGIAEDHSGGGFVDSQSLSMPGPEITLNTTEEHTGGGQDTTPVLTMPVATIGVMAQLV
ncbi:MAG: hypothetical protein LLF82_000086 [Dehalococcoides mccartyi]|uniref:hypothetical protein n=1 Tax=Dehalococcoides mccartyi TaxID=61435 RepID=UPI00242D46DC|nr:hypothetical protein [Dehalococcoides mccartyi]MCF7634622.1 hypothetical protein [Dehalococcoides mccartyi]